MRFFTFSISLEATGFYMFQGQGVMSPEQLAKPRELSLKDGKELFHPHSATTGWSCVQDKHPGKALGTFPNNEVDYPRRELAPRAGVIQK